MAEIEKTEQEKTSAEQGNFTATPQKTGEYTAEKKGEYTAEKKVNIQPKISRNKSHSKNR